MFDVTNEVIVVLAFIASIINGAIGYGFSSTITPIAVLFVSNKILNPALVLAELGVNLTLLFVERKNIKNTWRRAVPFAVGLLPGVIIGSIALSIIAPAPVKIVLYVVLLPLIVLQLLGVQRPIKNERVVSPILGTAVGFLYSLTTVSGPPLALYWRNNGLAKNEFRAVVAQIRVAEASFTTISYLVLGLFSNSSIGVFPYVFIPVLVGIPIGVFLLRKVSADFFRKLVMGADGIFVLFGLTSTLGTQNIISPDIGYLVFVLAIIPLIILTARMMRRKGKT